MTPGGPAVTLATRLYLALQPDRARQLAVRGFQAAVRRGAAQAIADRGAPGELTWLRTRVELDTFWGQGLVGGGGDRPVPVR
jgi:hypothetical protein